MQKFQRNRKIIYLLIGLEAIGSYTSISDTKYLSINKQIKTRYEIDINQINSYRTIYSYTQLVILVSHLYKLINEQKLSNFIQLILKKNNLLNAYKKNFYHIYINTSSYYTLNSNHPQKDIYNIALTNLYIIYIIQKTTNVLYLSYYLLT